MKSSRQTKCDKSGFKRYRSKITQSKSMPSEFFSAEYQTIILLVYTNLFTVKHKHSLNQPHISSFT